MTLAGLVHICRGKRKYFKYLSTICVSVILPLASLGDQLFIFQANSRKWHMGLGISTGSWGMKWRAVTLHCKLRMQNFIPEA